MRAWLLSGLVLAIHVTHTLLGLPGLEGVEQLVLVAAQERSVLRG